MQSAIRLDEAYGGTYNNNDCGFIADAVAGDAGAGFPQNDVFSDEQGGGFWRVVYSGADQVDPVQNWSTLVQPGDIVKMAWLDGGGHHVTTVVGTLTSGGLLPVFDNGDNDTIHIHDVDYWKGTDPASIIIFRLDPNQQDLIQGTDQGEFIQGSPYDNLIQPGLGADTIAAGASNSEMQGAAADLNGDTVNDFHTGDWFDLTDLDPSTATASYDATTGMLAVASSGSTVATINLPTSLLNNFAVLPDGSGGTQITDVACFAAGTRIRTPNGDVAAERLCPGDEGTHHHRGSTPYHMGRPSPRGLSPPPEPKICLARPDTGRCIRTRRPAARPPPFARSRDLRRGRADPRQGPDRRRRRPSNPRAEHPLRAYRNRKPRRYSCRKPSVRNLPRHRHARLLR